MPVRAMVAASAPRGVVVLEEGDIPNNRMNGVQSVKYAPLDRKYN